METYRIDHYVINVEINEAYRPGVKATVTVKPERPNAKYASVYLLLMSPDDTPKDLAQRAFLHYKMGTKPDERIAIQRGIIDETRCDPNMEKVYTLWGIKTNGNREYHYYICDGLAKDENEMKTIAENIKNNGFFFNNDLIFPESVAIVIYWQRTFPATPITEKTIIV